jgi:predicted nucleic acid-binding protein
VRFWDASAIVPLLVTEDSSRRMLELAAREDSFLVWWGSEIECVSALARREREGALDSRTMANALRRLQQIASAWHEVDPSDGIRETAKRFLRVHPLRAADALQLAAAFAASEQQPASLEIVTLDDRLADAARKEGFGVVELTDE